MQELIEFLRLHGPKGLKTPQAKPILRLHQRVLANPYSLNTSTIKELIELGYPFTPPDRLFLIQALNFEKCKGRIPKKPLRGWISKQRKRRREGTLDPRREHFLDRIGIIWDLDEWRWERDMKVLKTLEKHLGGYYVNISVQMRGWFSRLRRDRLKLTPKQIKELDDAGFIWDPYETIWDSGLKEIAAYQKRFGHGNIPRENQEYPRGSVLLSGARPAYRIGRLPKERIEQLEARGVLWKVVQDIWNMRFDELKEIYQKFGVVKIPKDWPENPTLGRWYRNLRSNWRNLTPEKKKRLESIGITKKSHRKPGMQKQASHAIVKQEPV